MHTPANYLTKYYCKQWRGNYIYWQGGGGGGNCGNTCTYILYCYAVPRLAGAARSVFGASPTGGVGWVQARGGGGG